MAGASASIRAICFVCASRFAASLTPFTGLSEPASTRSFWLSALVKNFRKRTAASGFFALAWIANPVTVPMTLCASGWPGSITGVSNDE